MNVIVLPLYGIGDVLMMTPALRMLKEQKRASRVTCLCMFRNTYDVLKNNPDIDSLVYFDFMEKKNFYTLNFIRSLRGAFDFSINFYPSNRRQYNMLAYLIGAGKRIGHRYLHCDLRELNFLKNRTVIEKNGLHNVEENIKLLEFIGVKPGNIPQMKIYLTPEEICEGKKHIRDSGNGKKIGIHAGTSIFKGHGGKRWPLNNFAELIDLLDQADFYLFGGPDDKDINKAIVKKLKDPARACLIEDMAIRHVAAVMRNMDLFISNDSGLMHLAAAVGVPVAAIFGPTDPDSLRPWGVINRTIKKEMPCSPCFYYSPKPLECVSAQKFRCLEELSVETVYNPVNEMLNGPDKVVPRTTAITS